MGRSPASTITSRTGPIPDPNSAQSARRGLVMRKIPRDACKGNTPPEWPPYMPDADEQEWQLWERLWQLPQAVIWRENESLDLVALYCRGFVANSGPQARPTSLTVLARQGDGLLLSPSALMGARVAIVDREADVPTALATVAESRPRSGRVVPRTQGSDTNAGR